MALSDFGLNPYVDLRTGTLYNKVVAHSAEELKERENTFVNLRMAELKESPVQGKLDFAHLKEIHHRLFQDVYDWAGKARLDFDAAKQDYQGGRSYAFTPSAQIQAEGKRVFEKLAAHDHLQGLTRKEFVPELAKLHGELNHLHTFPEGNGRTQRLFLEQVAQKAGHPVDLSIGTEHRIIEASIAQTKGQHGMMGTLHRGSGRPRPRACDARSDRPPQPGKRPRVRLQCLARLHGSRREVFRTPLRTERPGLHHANQRRQTHRRSCCRPSRTCQGCAINPAHCHRGTRAQHQSRSVGGKGLGLSNS